MVIRPSLGTRFLDVFDKICKGGDLDVASLTTAWHLKTGSLRSKTLSFTGYQKAEAIIFGNLFLQQAGKPECLTLKRVSNCVLIPVATPGFWSVAHARFRFQTRHSGAN